MQVKNPHLLWLPTANEKELKVNVSNRLLIRNVHLTQDVKILEDLISQEYLAMILNLQKKKNHATRVREWQCIL